jgi:hypothetical protein
MNKLILTGIGLTVLLFVFLYARLLGVALFILLINIIIWVVYIQERRINNCEKKTF